MNIVKKATQAIKEILDSNKNGVRTYDTQARADSMGEGMSKVISEHFGCDRPCRYLVIAVDLRGEVKYTPIFDLTELMGRKDFGGGYLGVAKGFYKF